MSLGIFFWGVNDLTPTLFQSVSPSKHCPLFLLTMQRQVWAHHFRIAIILTFKVQKIFSQPRSAPTKVQLLVPALKKFSLSSPSLCGAGRDIAFYDKRQNKSLGSAFKSIQLADCLVLKCWWSVHHCLHIIGRSLGLPLRGGSHYRVASVPFYEEEQ